MNSLEKKVELLEIVTEAQEQQIAKLEALVLRLVEQVETLQAELVA